MKDDSKFKFGLASKVAKALSKVVGFAVSVCAVEPFAVGTEAVNC